MRRAKPGLCRAGEKSKLGSWYSVVIFPSKDWKNSLSLVIGVWSGVGGKTQLAVDERPFGNGVGPEWKGMQKEHVNCKIIEQCGHTYIAVRLITHNVHRVCTYVLLAGDIHS